MMSGKNPDCNACGFEKVIPENFEVMSLVETYMGLMVDGMGSINASGISKVFGWEEIELERQRHLLLKLLLYIGAALNARSEKTTFSKSGSKATKTVSKSGSRETITYKG
jgi:hypothetical protein